jgi:Domain of unknown function (DUF4145)
VVWQNSTTQPSKSYTCGFCSNLVASSQGYVAADTRGRGRIYVCPHCDNPTYFVGDSQFPGVAPGAEVAHLPKHVEALYKEARQCTAAGASTGAVLCARKLLMNIAVEHGAPEGQSFVAYIEFLAQSGFIPPNGRAWVDHIRAKGNEATHEIVAISHADAEQLITLAEMLLKFIFEFPNRVPKSGGA